MQNKSIGLSKVRAFKRDISFNKEAVKYQCVN